MIARMNGCFSTLWLSFTTVELGQRHAGYEMPAQQSLFLSSASTLNLLPPVITLANPLFSQPFWGNMVAAAGAGPFPIPHKTLDSKSLSEGISYCLTPEAMAAARNISSQMAEESGVQAAVQSFHANLPLEKIQCDLIPQLPASWRYNKTPMKFSKLAAQILIDNALINPRDLSL